MMRTTLVALTAVAIATACLPWPQTSERDTVDDLPPALGRAPEAGHTVYDQEPNLAAALVEYTGPGRIRARRRG